MPVIDSFKLYNTLKGIELVTSNDFLKACEKLGDI